MTLTYFVNASPPKLLDVTSNFADDWVTRSNNVFLVNASPPKWLDVLTSNFAGIYRSHDIEGTGQSFGLT